MTTPPTQAHAIDIEKCEECPYCGYKQMQPEDKTAQCTHPNRLAFEQLQVAVEEAPPKSCPHRVKLTVLRVTAPVATRRTRRHLKRAH